MIVTPNVKCSKCGTNMRGETDLDRGFQPIGILPYDSCFMYCPRCHARCYITNASRLGTGMIWSDHVGKDMSSGWLIDDMLRRRSPLSLCASQKIIDFIISFEKPHNKDYHEPYDDNKGFATIGFGHLITKRSVKVITIPENFQHRLSEWEVLNLFKEDLEEHEKGVKNAIKVPLHQNEYDALTSLVYNCGPKALIVKFKKLTKYLNEGNYDAAAKEFLDGANRRRRKMEYDIFTKGYYVNNR